MRRWMRLLLTGALVTALAAPGTGAAATVGDAVPPAVGAADPGAGAVPPAVGAAAPGAPDPSGAAVAPGTPELAPALLAGIVTDQLGRPVPGAEVEVHRLGVGLVDVVTATPDGRFAVGDPSVSDAGGDSESVAAAGAPAAGAPGPALYRLRAHARGFRALETPWFDPARNPYQSLRLTPMSGGLQIALRDPQGERLSGSALLIGPGGRLEAELRGDAGLLSREELPAGTYRVLVMAPGHRSAQRQVTVHPGQAAALTVTLDPAGLVVSGEVRDAVTGAPLTTGRVELLGADRTLVASAAVGADGRFTLSLPRAAEGSYTVRAAAPGYQTAQTPATPMTGGRRYDFSGGDALALQPLTAAVKGELLSHYGYPLRQTRVVLELQGYGEVAAAETDEEGRFAFEAVPAAPGLRYRVLAEEVWDPASTDWMELPPGLTTHLLVRTAAGNGQAFGPGSLSGLVTDPRGAPVEGATVELIRGGQVVESATTDAEGAFLFPEVRATRERFVEADPYALRVSREGYLTTREAQLSGLPVTAIPIDADERTAVRVTLRPTAADLRGRVLDGDGWPVEGAAVELLGNGHLPVRTARTDAAGWYVLTDVPAQPLGSYSLRVRADGYRPVGGVDVTEAAAAGSALPTVRLTARAASFTGRVRGLDGRPLEGVALTLRGAGGQVLAEGATDADGFYRITTGSDHEGPVALIAARKGFAQGAVILSPDANTGGGAAAGTGAAAGVTASAGTRTDAEAADLMLTPTTASLEGRVLDPLGRPVGYARVELIQEGRGVIRTVTAWGSGLYRFEDVPLDGPGWFWLRVYPQEGRFAGSLTHGTEMVPLLRLVPGRHMTVDLRVRLP